MRAAAVAVGTATTSAAAASTSWAAPVGSDAVELDVTGCADAEAVRAAARVELAEARPSVGRVAVVCLGASRVLVVAFQRGADRPVAREVAIDDVAVGSRARAVAIVLAELVRNATAPDPLTTGPGATPRVPPVTSPPAPLGPSPLGPPVSPGPPTVVVVNAPARPGPDPSAGARGWAVGASLHQRAFAPSGALAIGPTVEVDVPLPRSPLRLRGVGRLAIADEERSVGTATITSWTGAASLLARTEAAALTFDAGPMLELGVATAAGTPAGGVALESTTTTAPLVLAGGQIVLGARLAGILVPFVAVDGGAVLAGVTASVDGDHAPSMAGVFLGVRMGLAVGPGD